MPTRQDLFPQFTLNDATSAVVWQAACALSHNIKRHNLIVLACDDKAFPAAIGQTFLSGLKENAIGVVPIGCTTIQGLAYTVMTLRAFAGIILGKADAEGKNLSICLVRPNAVLTREEIKINATRSMGRGETPRRLGFSIPLDYENGYIDFLVSSLPRDHLGVIIWDGRLFPGKKLFRTVVDRLPGHHIMFPEKSGNKRNLTSSEDFRAAIIRNSARAGIVLDDTGSSFQVYTNLGQQMPRHAVFAGLVHDLSAAARHSHPIVMSDIGMPDYIFETIRQKGFQPRIVNNNISNVRDAFFRHPVELVSHQSGFYFSSLQHSVADGLYGAVRFIRFLGSLNEALDVWKDREVPHLHWSRVTLNIGHGDLDDLYTRLEHVLRSHKKPYTRLDGFRVSEERGAWILIPQKQSQRLALIIFGLFPHDLVTMRAHMKKYLAEAGVTVTFPNEAIKP